MKKKIEKKDKKDRKGCWGCRICDLSGCEPGICACHLLDKE